MFFLWRPLYTQYAKNYAKGGLDPSKPVAINSRDALGVRDHDATGNVHRLTLTCTFEQIATQSSAPV
jgi:hypothetical protein